VILKISNLAILPSCGIDIFLRDPAAIDEDGFPAGTFDNEGGDDIVPNGVRVAKEATPRVLPIGNNEGSTKKIPETYP